jgi:hypothetical protein
METSCGRVVRTRRQLRRVVRAEVDAEAAGAELGIVGAVGRVRTQRNPDDPRRRGGIPGDKDKRRRRWRMERGEAATLTRGEEEAAEARGRFCGGWRVREPSLYSARGSRRRKFSVREKYFFPR